MKKLSILIGLLGFAGWATAGNLVFQHSSGDVITLSPIGNATFSGRLIERSTSQTPKGELQVLKGSDRALWTEEQGSAHNTNLAHDIITGYSTNQPVGLVLYSSTGNVAELHGNGDLFIAGRASQTKKATYYARGFGGGELAAFDAFDQRIYYNEAVGRVVSLPSGGTESEYYLKDHLGSTRTVVKEDATALQGLGLVAAYDYAPFGEQIVRQEESPIPDVTETFTGKEFDDEGANPAEGVNFGLNLYYFGARYYDPEIGLWTSVDPGRQFWGAYLYAGNGYSPITGKDPNGKELRYAPGTSSEFKKEFASAIQYLNKGKAAGPIARLHAMEQVVYVQEGLEDQYLENVITWNPFSALRTKTGGTQTPALGFLHETSHALDWLTNAMTFFLPAIEAPDLTEQRALEMENTAALKLGESPRKDYWDVSATYSVKHSYER